MNCTDLLSHLSDYFDDELTVELREEIRIHTTGCSHCRVVLDTTNQTIAVYKDNEVYELSDELRDRLHTAIMAKCNAKIAAHTGTETTKPKHS
jgi:Putative zinc-finger